jgi:hypothetical protein
LEDVYLELKKPKMEQKSDPVNGMVFVDNNNNEYYFNFHSEIEPFVRNRENGTYFIVLEGEEVDVHPKMEDINKFSGAEDV